MGSDDPSANSPAWDLLGDRLTSVPSRDPTLAPRDLSLPVALLLGLAIHLDGHVARHEHDGRSLGWDAHWLLAIPIFALAARRIARRWPPPDHPCRPAALTVALRILLRQVIEPLGEIIHYQATLAEELKPARLTAFALFTATGLVTMGLTLWALARRPSSGPC